MESAVEDSKLIIVLLFSVAQDGMVVHSVAPDRKIGERGYNFHGREKLVSWTWFTLVLSEQHEQHRETFLALLLGPQSCSCKRLLVILLQQLEQFAQLT